MLPFVMVQDFQLKHCQIWSLKWKLLMQMVNFRSVMIAEILLLSNYILQVVNDKEKLKAFAGCFGLAGIVTSITFKMDAMTWARFHPKKSRMIDSIPRPDGDTNSDVRLLLHYFSLNLILNPFRPLRKW